MFCIGEFRESIDNQHTSPTVHSSAANLITCPEIFFLVIYLITITFFLDSLAEVELLLEPEEKAILQENEFPNVKKISSVKFSQL